MTDAQVIRESFHGHFRRAGGPRWQVWGESLGRARVFGPPVMVIKELAYITVPLPDEEGVEIIPWKPGTVPLPGSVGLTVTAAMSPEEIEQRAHRVRRHTLVFRFDETETLVGLNVSGREVGAAGWQARMASMVIPLVADRTVVTPVPWERPVIEGPRPVDIYPPVRALALGTVHYGTEQGEVMEGRRFVHAWTFLCRKKAGKAMKVKRGTAVSCKECVKAAGRKS